MIELFYTYISLCQNLCFKDDYSDKQKVKKHNRSMTEIKKLEEKISVSDHAEDIEQLLSHEDERVRLNIAAFCLKKGTLRSLAVRVLSNLEINASDSTISFSAKMVLKTYCLPNEN